MDYFELSSFKFFPELKKTLGRKEYQLHKLENAARLYGLTLCIVGIVVMILAMKALTSGRVELGLVMTTLALALFWLSWIFYTKATALRGWRVCVFVTLKISLETEEARALLSLCEEAPAAPLKKQIGEAVEDWRVAIATASFSSSPRNLPASLEALQKIIDKRRDVLTLMASATRRMQAHEKSDKKKN